MTAEGPLTAAEGAAVRLEDEARPPAPDLTERRMEGLARAIARLQERVSREGEALRARVTALEHPVEEDADLAASTLVVEVTIRQYRHGGLVEARTIEDGRLRVTTHDLPPRDRIDRAALSQALARLLDDHEG